MSIKVEIAPPQLAAFGAPIWAYKPVTVLGVEIATAVVAIALGLALVAVPVAVAFVVGGELNTAHGAHFDGPPVPSSFVVVDRPAYVPAAR